MKQKVWLTTEIIFSWGLRSFWCSKYGFLSVWCLVKWPLRRELDLFYTPKSNFGPRWTQTLEVDFSMHILTCFFLLISGLYFASNWPEMLRNFYLIIFQLPQKWPFFDLNLHEKCTFGRFLVIKSPEMAKKKKHVESSAEIFHGIVGLFWSSKEVEMTKCCLVCIRAQAPLEEALVLQGVLK